jgi:hypothetical protein
MVRLVSTSRARGVAGELGGLQTCLVEGVSADHSRFQQRSDHGCDIDFALPAQPAHQLLQYPIQNAELLGSGFGQHLRPAGLRSGPDRRSPASFPGGVITTAE